MTSFSKTILRPLTTEDVAAIEAMCQDVYKGLDYLPGVIESWIAEKNVQTLGMEQNGVLVAVNAAHIVDDGQTAVLEGLRVHPDHQGRGIGSLIFSALLELVRREVPTVGRFRTSFTSENKASARLTADWTHLCSSTYSLFEFTEEILQSEPTSGLLSSDSLLKPASCEELCSELLTRRPAFLHNTFLCHCKPFTLLKGNLEKTIQEGFKWLVQRSEDGNVTSLSVGSFVSCPKFRMWTCDLYGCSREEVYFQAIEQLKYACYYSKAKAFFFKCCLPEEFTGSFVERIQALRAPNLTLLRMIANEKLLH